MKLLLTSLAIAILFGVAIPSSRAGDSISVDFFYDNLEPHGSWLEVGDYGYVWQPHDVQSDWTPYSDGRWIYTDAGWTWDSREPFGWAVYHYGRWANVRQVGWVWVPGIEWAPAWVSWRHSSRYVGWAPLPPEARFSVSIGFSGWVDDYYDIGPGNYRFVEGRHFGSPRLNTVFVDQRQNITIINETTNVTNITYRNNVVHNGGPVYDEQLRQSSDPIPQYKLDRRQGFDAAARRQSVEQLQSRVEGDTFSVAALPLIEGGGGKPENLDRTIPDAEIDRGWSEVGSREEIAQMRTKLRGKSAVPAELPEAPTFEKPFERPVSPEVTTGRAAEKGRGNRNIRDAVPAPPVELPGTMTPPVVEPGAPAPDESDRPEERSAKGARPDRGGSTRERPTPATPGLPPMPRPGTAPEEIEPGTRPPAPVTPRPDRTDRQERPEGEPAPALNSGERGRMPAPPAPEIAIPRPGGRSDLTPVPLPLIRGQGSRPAISPSVPPGANRPDQGTRRERPSNSRQSSDADQRPREAVPQGAAPKPPMNHPEGQVPPSRPVEPGAEGLRGEGSPSSAGQRQAKEREIPSGPTSPPSGNPEQPGDGKNKGRGKIID